MSTPSGGKPSSSFGLIAERCFEGSPPERIAAESGLHARVVAERLAHLDALLLLLAHDFPVNLMPRVTGLSPLEVHAYLDEVRERIGSNDRVREHLRKRGALATGGSSRGFRPWRGGVLKA